MAFNCTSISFWRVTIKRSLLIFLSLVLALITITTGVYTWAMLSIDRSLIARALIWGESDVDDWKRFPFRLMHASPEPVFFATDDPIHFPDEMIRYRGIYYTIDEFLKQSNTTAFIIVHDDKLLYEKYFNGSNREATQTSMSVAKSFLSTLVGIAIQEGFIGNVDESVTKYIPELAERDPRFANITLCNLLTMCSGLRFEYKHNGINDSTITYYAPNLREIALESQIIEAPGIQFQYNDYNALLIGLALERATGMPVTKYLETRLWQPMGAEGNGSWSLDSEQSGFEKMSTGINGRAIDFAKLGWLFLHQGLNMSRQVVPTNWVKEATRANITTDPAIQYQYFWWVNKRTKAYWAEGYKCQYIYIYPAAELVIVRTGINCGQDPRFSTGTLHSIATWLENHFK